MAADLEDLKPGMPVLVRATVRERNYRSTRDDFTFDVEFAGNSRVTLERDELVSVTNDPQPGALGAGVDIGKIKPGDEVTVRCKVVDLHGNPEWPVILNLHPVTRSLALEQPGKPFDGRAYVFREAIVSHTIKAKAIAVGDRVVNIHCATLRSENKGGEVLAVVDGWAMVRFWDRAPGCVRVSDLERL